MILPIWSASASQPASQRSCIAQDDKAVHSGITRTSGPLIDPASVRNDCCIDEWLVI